MSNLRSGRLGPPFLILIGAVLLIVALVTPWYSIAISVHGGDVSPNTQDAYFYPGLPSTSGTVREVCSGSQASQCSSQTSYEDYGDYPQTGSVAEDVYILLIAGIALAVVAVILGLLAPGNRRRANLALVIALLALVIGAAASGFFAGALPGAIGNDMHYHSGNGPWSTFFGSNTSTTGNRTNITGTITWGPSTGWFLSIGASVVLLGGLVLLARHRREAVPAAPHTSVP
jgi:LPXTG cell wall anchor motif